MTSLSKMFELVKQAEFEAKLASVQEAWKDDDVRVELLDEAMDIIKAAQEGGQLPQLDEAQILDLGVALVEDSLEGLDEVQTDEAQTEKTAEEGEVELDKQAAAELGEQVGELLADLGLTSEDLEKMAEDEAEELGRMVAQELVSRSE